MTSSRTASDTTLSDAARDAPTRDRRRLALGALAVAWGAQAIVTQSLLLREALVLMSGSEFAWGVVLFAWLMGVAIGATVGGFAADRISHPAIALLGVLFALGAVTCVELAMFRGARAWLGVEPGRLLPMATTAIATILCVSPAGALVGMAFPLACRALPIGRDATSRGLKHSRLLRSDPRTSIRADLPNLDGVWQSNDRCTKPESPANKPTTRRGRGGTSRGLKPAARGDGALSFGRIYALESLGSLFGGAAFTFWAVDRIRPIETALLCTAVTMAASAGLIAALTRRITWAVLTSGVAATLAVGTWFAGTAIDNKLVLRRWADVAPGYELVAETESKYQNLAVGRRAGQYTLYCDGQVSADFPDPYTFAPLAHFWMCQHPEPRNVLLLGGGAEGLLSEMLRHPVDHIDYVESDPRRIDLIQPFLDEADQRALRDPRVTTHYVDPRFFLKSQHDRFDLVLARLPEPISASKARFFTDEFYGELRRAMRRRAVLCMTAAAAPGELPEATAAYLASIRTTIGGQFPQIIIGWGDPAQILAATEPDLITTDPTELTRRYADRGVTSEMFNPAWFDGASDWVEPKKVARRAADLDAVENVRRATDLWPTVYLQRLALWDRATGGEAGWLIERLRAVRLIDTVGMLVGMGVLTLIYCRLRHGRPAGWSAGAVTLSTATTGLVTMSLSIVWLFAFQNLCGYVYQRIGWIIAVFMGGLVVGCLLADETVAHTRRSGGGSTILRHRLIVVDVLLALMALAIPFVLPMLGGLQSGSAGLAAAEWCIYAGVAATGVLGGAVFPLAGALRYSALGRVGAATGSVVGADHAGACIGALLCGVLLVPVFGTVTTVLVLAGIKLVSALVLIAARQPEPRASARATS